MTAIVLAGGGSSRFGGDKLAAPLDGRPLLDHAVHAVARVADDVVVVLAPDAPSPVPPAGLAPRVRFVRDAEPGRGPLAGLQAGLERVADDPRRIVLLAGGDMPRMGVEVLRLMVDTLAASEGVAAMTLEAPLDPPLPLVIRPAAARQAIVEVLAAGRRSLRALLEALPSTIVPAEAWRPLDMDGITLRDVDTVADLEEF